VFRQAILGTSDFVESVDVLKPVSYGFGMLPTVELDFIAGEVGSYSIHRSRLP
jgi:hypothetical protein